MYNNLNHGIIFSLLDDLQFTKLKILTYRAFIWVAYMLIICELELIRFRVLPQVACLWDKNNRFQAHFPSA